MEVGGLLKAVWGPLQPCPSPLPQPMPASRSWMPSKHPRVTRNLERPRQARRQQNAAKLEEGAPLPSCTALAAPPSSPGEWPCLGRERPRGSFFQTYPPRLEYWILPDLVLGLVVLAQVPTLPPYPRRNDITFIQSTECQTGDVAKDQPGYMFVCLFPLGFWAFVSRVCSGELECSLLNLI